MSHGTFITLLIAFPGAALLSAFVFMSMLKRFMDETPSIDTNRDLDKFKEVVRKQMYAALLQIVLMGLPILIFLYGAVTGLMRFGDILYVIIPNTVVIIVGKALRKIEKKAQSLPVSSPELEKARNDIVYCWEKKPLPDW